MTSCFSTFLLAVTFVAGHGGFARYCQIVRKARGAALKKKTFKKLPKARGCTAKLSTTRFKKTPGFMTTPPGYEGCVYVQGILLRSQSVGIED